MSFLYCLIQNDFVWRQTWKKDSESGLVPLLKVRVVSARSRREALDITSGIHSDKNRTR